VALWIETVEPGKPLGFLDANIRCGDALLGVFDLEALAEGIPDAAYKPLAGDDKAAAKIAGRINREQREGAAQQDLVLAQGTADFAGAARAVASMPEDDLAGVEARARAYQAVHGERGWWATKTACDLYVAAFLAPKTFRAGGLSRAQTPDRIPTTLDLRTAFAGQQPDPQLVARAVELAGAARAFHWPLEFPAAIAAGGFDVVLGNPPWDTMSPDVKEFFSKYDEQVRFLSPADQKARVASLLETPGVRETWDALCRHLYVSANFMRDSGRYKLFAEGNLGKGDFNVYRMFVELALFLVRAGGRAAQFAPENLYNGANAAAIRRYLFEKCQLHALIGFENTKKVWFDIDSRAKFCLYSASPGSRTEAFKAAFGINTVEKLHALRSGLPFDIPVSLVEEFSPEALAIAEVAHTHDLAISRKLYARYPKFGAEVVGLAIRDYMREIDMGNDREDFDADPSGLPIYEGRMVEAFDHRAKAYVSGRGRKAVWHELTFGTKDKLITPQWRLARQNLPSKLTGRYTKYRVCFCDVGGVTNARFLMGSLIPPNVVCGHSVPTILFDPEDHRLMMLWLGVINSFVLDFLARKKAALHMTFTIMDSLPLPRIYDDTPVERGIASRALSLAATGREMSEFWSSTALSLGLNPGSERPEENLAQRESLRAEIDVLVARDLFALSKDEMRYLLDPSDILGSDCGFETFGALKRAEEKAFDGHFRTRDLILTTWDRLPAQSGRPELVKSA
jgi:hypothetical protein